MPEDPDFVRRMHEQRDWIRRITEGPEFVRQMRETQESIRRIAEGPEFVRQLRETQESIRRIAEGPEFVRQMRETQESIRRLTEVPDFNRRLQQTLNELRSPTGLAQVAAVLQDLELAAETDLDPSLEKEAEADDALLELRTALENWSADAGDVSALAAGSDSDAAFGWIDVLPTIVQLKLWLSTLDVLNALLLLVGFLSPASVPMGVVLAAEVLIRLNRALLERLGNEPAND